MFILKKIHFPDCSRFWECGPEGEYCLCECPDCPTEMNPLCNGKSALYFDKRYQYPVAPVCGWPSHIDFCGAENDICKAYLQGCLEDSDCEVRYGLYMCYIIF